MGHVHGGYGAMGDFDRLKPSDCCLYRQFAVCTASFKIPKFDILPTVYLYACTYLRTNSEFSLTHHLMIGFRNCRGKCLLCGANWVFE